MIGSIIGAITIFGSIFTIATLFIPDSWKQKKLAIIILIFIGLTLCSVIAYQSNELERKNSLRESANNLIKEKVFHTDEGFIHASLTFLEHNKEEYPEAYERALNIYHEHLDEDNRYADFLYANKMESIIRMMAILNDK